MDTKLALAKFQDRQAVLEFIKALEYQLGISKDLTREYLRKLIAEFKSINNLE